MSSFSKQIWAIPPVPLSFQSFQWSPLLGSQLRLIPPFVLLKIKWSAPPPPPRWRCGVGVGGDQINKKLRHCIIDKNCPIEYLFLLNICKTCHKWTSLPLFMETVRFQKINNVFTTILWCKRTPMLPWHALQRGRKSHLGGQAPPTTIRLKWTGLSTQRIWRCLSALTKNPARIKPVFWIWVKYSQMTVGDISAR